MNRRGLLLRVLGALMASMAAARAQPSVLYLPPGRYPVETLAEMLARGNAILVEVPF